ncbi:MAG: hypothetical protein PVH63_04915 [Balneolaceae bacterium]|jgi:hypothetical protein
MNDNQRTLSYTQKIKGTPREIFPLLCPERECDWLDGWDYEMIHSQSGFAEGNCVFKTPMHGKNDTYWVVSRYDPENFIIEFVRFTLPEVIVQIAIQVLGSASDFTDVRVSYTYTALSRAQLEYLKNQLEDDFEDSMSWWEKSMNYYLEMGEMLKRDEQR